MASPVDSARPTSSITSGGTSLNVNVGSPSAGNLLVVAIRWASAVSAVTFTGYTNLKSLVSDVSGDDQSLYYRVADGTEGTTDALSWTTAVKCCAICWVITGASTTIAPDVSTDTTGTAANVNPPSVSVTGGPKDVLYITVYGNDGEVRAATVAPTNYSNLVTANTGTAGAEGTNCELSGATRQITSSSSDDPGAFTNSAPNSGNTAWTIAVHPEPPSAILPNIQTLPIQPAGWPPWYS